MHGADTHSTSQAYTHRYTYIYISCHICWIQLICHLQTNYLDISIFRERSESTKSKNTYSQLVLEDMFGDRDGAILRSY